jgi:hypothetical protein
MEQNKYNCIRLSNFSVQLRWLPASVTELKKDSSLSDLLIHSHLSKTEKTLSIQKFVMRLDDFNDSYFGYGYLSLVYDLTATYDAGLISKMI